MRYLLLVASIFACLLASTRCAVAAIDISGTWQGMIQGPTGPVRRIMEITKAHGRWNVIVHAIDESDVPLVTQDVTVRNSGVRMRFNANAEPWFDYHRLYVATIAQHGNAMVGAWGIQHGPADEMIFLKVARPSWKIIEPKSHMVSVDGNVKDEVLDWGGTGRPVMLLAGLGNTAHIWYSLIPSLTAKYHVYSLTRRGFGTSSKPSVSAANYSADRLGDDVVAAMNALNIEKPVLVGHSMAGEELSDIGTRYPQKVAALIYLEAGYWYALRTPASSPVPLGTPLPGGPPIAPIAKVIIEDPGRTFTGPINVPILALFADPHDMHGHVPDAQIAWAESNDKKQMDAVADAFAHGLRNAKVIRVPNANEYIFISNPDDVVRDVNAFIATLPQ
ncbi:MAG: alpha/beta hydrolase [Candidatus Eremiobacteraeota bacterium]|nr:alpha/beta hydrolase [Candidatus Eremiobacteraeota bacterium]